MHHQFAKVYDLENGQVLLTADFTPAFPALQSEAAYVVTIRTDFDMFSVSVNHSFKSKQERDERMKLYTLADAILFRSYAAQQVTTHTITKPKA